MKSRYLLKFITIIVLITGGAGCADSLASSTDSSLATQQDEQAAVQQNQEKMVTAVSLPQLTNSLERINIKKRLETFDDPNKVSYIYLISYGRVMAFYVIKGKVTSGNKRLTSGQRQVEAQYYSSWGQSGGLQKSLVMEAPELDGTYGSSAPYIFFWTTDGVYVQWTGDYMLVDQPLKLTSQPELVRDIK